MKRKSLAAVVILLLLAGCKFYRSYTKGTIEVTAKASFQRETDKLSGRVDSITIDTTSLKIRER